MLRRLITLILLFSVLSGCIAINSGSSSAQREPAVEAVSQVKSQAQQPAATRPAPTLKRADSTFTAVPTIALKNTLEAQTPAAVIEIETQEMESLSEAINPLTGLPVKNAANLEYPPALVSVTNFPVSARPQAGLSFSPFVFEMYIGEGMTRFLAVFYGDFPVQEEGALALSDDRIGPVRSGRLPYENLRKLYNGFLVMASASSNVKLSMHAFTNVFGSDSDDINSAMIPVQKLEEIASQNTHTLKEGALSGLVFDHQMPANGKTGNMVWIPFSYLNQVIWRFDPSSGSYLRFQDNADAKTFIQVTDRINDQPLTYENVIILFADHKAKQKTLIEIDFMYINRMPALLFRDGQMYEIFWTTANDEYEKTTGRLRPIRFIDRDGNPFPLKPGQTWVELIPSFTRYNETVDSEVYLELKRKQSPGSGNWAIQFSPVLPE
jgi:hypothetical protein